jgi:hypothetical protein
LGRKAVKGCKKLLAVRWIGTDLAATRKWRSAIIGHDESGGPRQWSQIAHMRYLVPENLFLAPKPMAANAVGIYNPIAESAPETLETSIQSEGPGY